MTTRLAYSVADFCQLHGLSRTVFYNLLHDPERAPRIFKVGSRTYVSVEAAREWRERMERLTAGSIIPPAS